MAHPPSLPRRDGDEADNLMAPDDRADEEARLLEREEFEIGEDEPAIQHPRWRKRNSWDILRGPHRPRVLTIKPFFPSLQIKPVELLQRHEINRNVVTITILAVWMVVFLIFLSSQRTIYDSTGNPVLNLDCTDTLWLRKNYCGLHGIDCQPFSNRTFAFRCPANCAGVRVLNPHLVGSGEVNYRPLVIGTGTYRGDSFMCGAAIHAGIIRDAKGGCGRITVVGEAGEFESTLQHSIESIPFDGRFPLSFSVSKENRLECRSDPRSAMLPISIIFSSLLSISSDSPTIFYPIAFLIFTHTAFLSDPPSASHLATSVIPDHLSMYAKRILPATFIAVFVYRHVVKHSLLNLTAHFEKTILWLGGFWIGALSNYTFDWIPISRLTAHDLEQQPGAKLALAVIVITLAVIILGQAYCFWLEGRLLRYLGLYGLFIAGIGICLVLPGVNLRIHHYILALLLLPGTNLQTRPSLLYQGILLGLFVNGVARWDFDSVLQTSAALQNDARFDSVVPNIIAPTLVTDYTAGIVNAIFGWPPRVEGMDGVSVLINDVERARAFFDDDRMQAGEGFNWTRSIGLGSDEYFRWAYVKSGRTMDYSGAGTFWKNNTWFSG